MGATRDQAPVLPFVSRSYSEDAASKGFCEVSCNDSNETVVSHDDEPSESDNNSSSESDSDGKPSHASHWTIPMLSRQHISIAMIYLESTRREFTLLS